MNGRRDILLLFYMIGLGVPLNGSQPPPPVRLSLGRRAQATMTGSVAHRQLRLVVAVGSLSLYIYASMLLTLTLTWMTDCQTALAVLHTRAYMTALVF